MITIVLPVYNGGSLLRECIDSIAKQDAGPKAFDVVVLDNCSTDSGLESLSLLPKEVSRRVIRSSRVLSIEENWRRIRELDGTRPFITLIGHDDTLDPGFIRTMGRALAERPESKLLFAHFRLIDERGRLIRPCQPMGPYESAGHFLAGRLAGIRDSFGTGYVMRFDDYRNVGGIPSYTKLLYADDALWLSLAQRSGIHILETECFSYRLHPSSTSQVTDSGTVFNAFSEYLGRLEIQFSRDEGIRRAMTNYGPMFLKKLIPYWMLEEVNRANLANEAARPDVIDGWSKLYSRFFSLIGRRDAPPLDDHKELAFSLWSNRHPFRRRLWVNRPIRRTMRLTHRLAANVLRK